MDDGDHALGSHFWSGEKQTEIRQYMANMKKQLEYLTQRRSELQGRIADAERHVRDVEDIVQDWLAESRDGDE